MSDGRPRHYLVDGVPVTVVRSPAGVAQALALDAESGGFVPDPALLDVVAGRVADRSVAAVTADGFAQAVVDVRRPIVARVVSSAIRWQATGDAEVPYAAVLGGHRYALRVNDFPAEPLYTLVVGGDELADLEDWPAGWTRPEGRPGG